MYYPHEHIMTIDYDKDSILHLSLWIYIDLWLLLLMGIHTPQFSIVRYTFQEPYYITSYN